MTHPELRTVVRFRAVNAARVCEVLSAAGWAAVIGPAKGRLDNGCSDASCCAQHPARTAPDEWVGISTNASGHEVHRLVVRAKVIRPCGCRDCRREAAMAARRQLEAWRFNSGYGRAYPAYPED